MKKIALVIPYFGKWPEWIDLYFHSCSRNALFDVMIYTDCEIRPAWKSYENVLFRKIAFSAYCERVSRELGIAFEPRSAYKLCDLKPFYGYIHREELAAYDYWGFGDLDVIYGDMSVLINERNLRKYDFITTHSYHAAGHFTVMRNNRHYREAALRIPRWQTLLTDQQHHGLDESVWSDRMYPQLKYLRTVHSRLAEKLGIGLLTYLKYANKLFCNRLTRRHFAEYGTTPNPTPEAHGGQTVTWLYDLKAAGGGRKSAIRKAAVSSTSTCSSSRRHRGSRPNSTGKRDITGYPLPST